MKLANTSTILQLAAYANEKGYNQSLDVKWAEQELDPEGVHVCEFAFPHEHAGGHKTRPHLRTLWLLKLRDLREPMPGLLDIETSHYDQLTDHKEVPELADI